MWPLIKCLRNKKRALAALFKFLIWRLCKAKLIYGIMLEVERTHATEGNLKKGEGVIGNHLSREINLLQFSLSTFL